MSLDKLATIAVIFILGIPILLGFGLASEDQEVTRETTERGGSLSDVALNATSPYYVNYTGPNNNSMMQVDTYVSEDIETTLTAPEFVRTTATVSTVPVYETETGTMELSAVTERSYAGGTGQTDYVYPAPVRTSYTYDVAQPLYFQILSNSTYADPNATYVSPAPYMQFQISGTYQVAITAAGGTTQTVSTSGLLTIIETNQVTAWYGLTKLIVILSDNAQYEGAEVAITLNGLGMDVWKSQEQTLAPSDELLMTFPPTTPAVLRLDNTYYPLTNETRAGQLIYDSGMFVYMIGGEPYDSGANAYIAAGRSAGIKVATGAGYGVGDVSEDDTELPAFDYAFAYVVGTTAIAYYDTGYFTVSAGSSGGFTLMKDTADGWLVVLADKSQIRTGSLTVKLTTGSLNLLYRDTSALTAANAQWTADVSGTATVSITSAGSSTVYHAYARIFAITKSYDTVAVLSSEGTDTFTEVSAVGLALSAGNSSVDYTTYGDILSYAQIAYGWKLPGSLSVTYDKWLNGYSNGYVRLLVQIPSGGDLYIYGDSQNQDQLLRVRSSSGFVTVTIAGSDPVRLGAYTNVMIEYNSTADTITVSGIREWPAMGVYPEVLNQVSRSIDLEATSGLYLAQVSGSLTFRVDAARIQAGTFSTTKDYTLNMFQLFPDDDMQTLILDSVGVYGDSLIIGGRSFDIDGGNMAYNGESYRISGAKIGIVRDGDDYTFTLGRMTWTGSNGAVYFGGEWSLVMHREFTTVETTTEAAWVPGVFALDTDGFVLAMVLSAVGVFVVLGMWGAKSGSKIGILALICGAAVVLGLVLI